MREYEEPIDTNQVVEYWIKLPYKLNFIKKDIFFFLQKDLEVDWKVNDYFLQSIVRKDNDIGIYTPDFVIVSPKSFHQIIFQILNCCCFA